MRKRILLIALPLLLLLFIATGIALASYSADIIVTENGTTSHEMVGCNITANIQYMSNHDFFALVTGLDTRVNKGGIAQPHMLVDNKIMFAIPVAGNSTTNLQFVTDEVPLSSFYIIPGHDGYVTVTDNATLEPGINFAMQQTGWVDTSFSALDIEDYTTYTEVDVNGKLTVVAARATGIDVDSDEDVYLYKNMGANYFNGLDIDFELYFDSLSLVNSYGGMAITNTIDDVSGLAGTDISVLLKRDGAADWRIVLVRGANLATDFYNCATDTPYYCTLERVAGNDSVSLEIYSDPSRVTLLDTLTVAGFGATKYQYAFGFINYNTGNGNRDFDGYVQNMSLTGSTDVPSLIHKSNAFSTYVSATGNITSSITGGAFVTATGISSGARRVVTTADGVNLVISVYDVNNVLIDSDTAALGGVGIPNTTHNWIFFLYNSMPYCDNMTITIGGTLVLHYEPEDYIRGTTLPDLEAPVENGEFHWGSNAPGIFVTLGSMESGYTGVPVDPTETADVAPILTPPPASPADAARLAGVATHALTPIFHTFSIATGIYELWFWWVGTIIVSFMIFGFAYKWLHNMMITGAIFCVPYGYVIAIGIMDLWVIMVLIIILAGCIMMQNRRTA